MVYVFSRNNFFAALYLAHDMEDECDEDKWEILPWALGRRWKLTFPEFIKTKNQVLQSVFFLVNKLNLAFEHV